MARFCSACGSEMVDNAAFCPKCGKSVAPSAPASQVFSGSGVKDNVAGLLAYLFIPAIIFLILNPYNRNRYIRFHSFQAILVYIAWAVADAIFGLIPFIGWLILIPITSLFGFAVVIVCMIKAYQGQVFRLPWLGEKAEQLANN